MPDIVLVQGKPRAEVMVPFTCSYRGIKVAIFQGQQWPELSISDSARVLSIK